jgi:hypothetical protein
MGIPKWAEVCPLVADDGFQEVNGIGIFWIERTRAPDAAQRKAVRR